MIRNCFNHKLQTSPRNHEKESWNANSQKTPAKQLSDQLPVPHQNECKTRRTKRSVNK